jgi:DNA-binding CsgD family transcriptional regulator
MMAVESLFSTDLLALNRAIGEIYTARDRESFYRAAFSAIHGIIPEELCTFNETTFHSTRFLNSISSSQEHSNISKKFFPALNAHLHEHPFIPHIFFIDKALKTTDYCSKRQFKSAALYNEFYHHLDIEAQMSLALPLSQKNLLVFTLSKKSQDFSERDRLLLTLLKPHMMSALRNAMEHGRIRLERDLLQKGAETERQGAVLFQCDGMIVCLSPFAKELLANYFDTTLAEGDMLPIRLLSWFKTEDALRSAERPSLIIEKEDRCIKITLLNDFTTGDSILIITETDNSLSLHNLQGYDLSRREVEVLSWLSKGKTNVEIAVILGTSRRTVEKHVEHIFAKLGVETRAAAAAKVSR